MFTCDEEGQAGLFKEYTAAEVAIFVSRINRLPLESEDLEELRDGIRTLFQTKIPVVGQTLMPGQKLFRGVSHDTKPTSVDKLGAPPDEKVCGFQRCNGPGRAMFYCAAGIAPIYFELKPKVGDKIYISRWSVVRPDFAVLKIYEPDHSKLSPAISSIYQFFDTKFTEPIHDSFSYRYKVTAVITDFLLHEGLFEREHNIAGIKYTSTAYPSKAENLAILPSTVAESMLLESVDEFEIEEVTKDGFRTKRLDFTTRFDGDGQILWEGRGREWKIPPKSIAIITQGDEGWSVTDADGNVIDPT
ncbi:hypothetical protein [uncultured Roseibium sp.]|uniref:hypothetical protein n=1 Tax=uncultured Roseibium sp. TaxID=1936171 RepID=UPI002607F69F|nr:hypothetical protein [uncultured Roseibium sp.]